MPVLLPLIDSPLSRFQLGASRGLVSTTPGCRLSRPMTSRPFSAMSSMLSRVIDAPTRPGRRLHERRLVPDGDRLLQVTDLEDERRQIHALGRGDGNAFRTAVLKPASATLRS